MKRSQNGTITNFFKKVKKDGEPLEAALSAESVNSVSRKADAVNDEKVKVMAVRSQHASFSTSASASQSTLKPVSNWSKDQWIATLSSREQELLKLEIATLDETWLSVLARQLSRPYFLSLKQFLADQRSQNKTIFPPPEDIYSWSRFSSLTDVRVIILGQDPYHNYNQAHGLAFSVNPPTPAPPSLVNIFKELEACYPDTFKRPPNGGGLLTPWAEQGVLMLNACLTVEAHKANSHANRGWEQFTEKVIEAVLENNPKGVCLMVWGSPAAKRIEKIRPGPAHLILKSVHPSPLSASRGWFGSKHFVKANDWLQERYNKTIDWNLGKL